MSELLGLLRRAVAARMSDGAVVVLSGGLDSSAVAMLAPGAPCFTGYYDERGFDERHYARLVIEGSPREWHQVQITPRMFVQHFDEFAAAVEPPYEGVGAFGQFIVGKAIARRGYRIALSGEGADELFGGYARLSLVAGRNVPDNYDGYHLPPDYPRDLTAALEFEMAHLPALLRVDDQCMAAHGIEARAPFTDERVTHYALALAPEWRVGKTVLRQAVRGLVPDQIIDRTDKMGFPAPFVRWAQEEPVRSFVKARLGYVPSAERPWAREWFHELTSVCSARVAA